MTNSPIKSGLWRHTSGSELELVVEGPAVRGRYRTAGGRPGLGSWFPVTGVINGELLGFCVSWEEFGSLTSWCGRYEVKDGHETLRTTWLLGRLYADKALREPTAPWETVHVGQDIYTFIKALDSAT